MINSCDGSHYRGFLEGPRCGGRSVMADNHKDSLVAVVIPVSPSAIRETSRAQAARMEA